MSKIIGRHKSAPTLKPRDQWELDQLCPIGHRTARALFALSAKGQIDFDILIWLGSCMYFAQSSKGLITGPSIANVVKQLGAKPNYNHTYLRRHFSNGAHFAQPNDELTLYEGVFRVPLGSQLA
jgi:hypothetical protein